MKRKFILLVEDNADDEELTRRAFQKENTAKDWIVARDGAEALDYLFQDQSPAAHEAPSLPSVVLLDLNLPKVSGLDVLRRIRNDERMKLLPVVVFTSSSEEEDVLSSYRLGANSYVRKPVVFEEFAHAVRKLEDYWLIINQPPVTPIQH